MGAGAAARAAGAARGRRSASSTPHEGVETPSSRSMAIARDTPRMSRSEWRPRRRRPSRPGRHRLHAIAPTARRVSGAASPSASSTGRIARPIAPSSRSEIPAAGWRSLTLRARRSPRARACRRRCSTRRLSSERPLLILSGNSIEHGLLALAAMYSGVLYAPIAPAYSLQARGVRHARPDLRSRQPGAGIRGGRRRVRARRCGRCCRPAPSSSCPRRRRTGSRAPRRLPSSSARLRLPPSTRRTRGSARTRSPRSSSRRGRQAGRRASSTRSECCARTRR